MPDENRARMTLVEAEKRLRHFPADVRYIVANEDGSFSIAGYKTPESKILEQPVYDIVVVATKKTTTRPGDFVHLMQQAAAEPITLRNLIQHLIDTYRPATQRKVPATVIRARTLSGYTTLGYLRRHVNYHRTL
jgi:hypothetical protein